MKKEDMKKQKNLVIFAGVNGAGKSTAYEIDPCLANNLPIINPDVYAKELALEKENGNIKIYPCNEEINKRLQDAVIKIKNLTSKNIETNKAQKEIGHTSFLHSKNNSKDIER